MLSFCKVYNSSKTHVVAEANERRLYSQASIIEKTAKFYSVCHNVDERHFAPEFKRSIADRSPSQTAVSTSVLPDLKRRHLESKSSSL